MARIARESGASGWRIVWWLFFALICVLALWASSAQKAALYQAAKQYEKRYQAFDQAAAASMRETNRALAQLRTQDPAPTREEVEALLKAGQLSDAASDSGVAVAKYVEPVTGRTRELRFVDGRLSHVGTPVGNLTWPAAPMPTPAWQTGELIRGVIVRWGPLGWLILLPIAVYCVWRARGRATLSAASAADGLLMISLLVLLASALRWGVWLVAGKANTGWRPETGLTHVAMVCISLGLLVWGHIRARAIDPGLCPVCRYDLTGNVSGVCPECGTALRESER
jgi:hypothetical protein